MSSTHTSLNYHLIFATKNREPRLAGDSRQALHAYIGGTIRGLGGRPMAVDGVADHVHILVSLSASHRLSDFMRELKKTTSVWFQERARQRDFHWQDGYAAFTVSASAIQSVIAYVEGQEEHHRAKTFREELELFLKKSGIEFEERYLD